MVIEGEKDVKNGIGINNRLMMNSFNSIIVWILIRFKILKPRKKRKDQKNKKDLLTSAAFLQCWQYCLQLKLR